MSTVVPVFPSPSSVDFSARRFSPNVAFYVSLHSSPWPFFSRSWKLSALRKNERCNRRREVEAKESSSFHYPANKELAHGPKEAESRQFARRRNVRSARVHAQGEESVSRARILSASHDYEGKLPWVLHRRQARDVKASAMQRRKSTKFSELARTSESYDREQGKAWPKQSRSSSGAHEYDGPFAAKKRPRAPLPTENQQSRLHNEATVFEGITQPYAFGLSGDNHAHHQSSPRDAHVALSNVKQQRSKSTIERLGYRQNLQKGALFMSKLEEVLSDLKLKDESSKHNFSIIEEAQRAESASSMHATRGSQNSTSEGKGAQVHGADKFLKGKDTQSARLSNFGSSAENATRAVAEDKNQGQHREGKYNPTDGKGLQSDLGQARLFLKKTTRGDETGFTSFNLFSSSPSVPWEADRSYSSPFKPTSRTRMPLGRHLTTSIGSRSSPSQRSVTNRNRNSKREKLMEPWFGGKEDIITQDASKLKNDKIKTKLTSKKRSSRFGEPVESIFDWSDSDDEEKLDNVEKVAALRSRPDYEDNVLTQSNFSELDSDRASAVFSDAEDDLPTPSSSFGVDGRDADDPIQMNSSEGSPDIQKYKMAAFTKHTSSATPAMDASLGVSDTWNGSNPPNTANWHKHNLPDLPFEFQFSYSETPNRPILGYRETPASPFGPATMTRPWLGGAPMKPSKKQRPMFDSFNPPPKDLKGLKLVQDPGPYPEGQGPKAAKSREEIMGEPLTKEEIVYLVEKCQREKRQLNLGRDGLTHNMLDLIHSHWKRRRVVKIKCKGVPTVDMANVKFHIEDKTAGKIIYQTGGILYLFRGRNYNYKDRPHIPLMLWKPATPVYPKLIELAPDGLTKEEARRLRQLGRKVEPICRIGKNGVYLKLADEVRAALRVDELVQVDCRGLNPSDYKRIGAKLRDLVPCVLLSFEKERILMWRGKQESLVEGTSMSQAPDSEATPDNTCNGTEVGKVNISLATLNAFLHGDKDSSEEVDSHLPNVISKLSEHGRAETGVHAGFDTASEELSEVSSSFPVQQVVDCTEAFDGLASDKGQIHEGNNSPSEHVVDIDALWEHALQSGMAIELLEEDMDSDLTVRKAEELAQSAPLAPTYTTKLMYKLQLKRDKPTDDLRIHFGRLQTQRPKKVKVVNRKLQLPTVGVPGMGGLPVDELAKLLVRVETKNPV